MRIKWSKDKIRIPERQKKKKRRKEEGGKANEEFMTDGAIKKGQREHEEKKYQGKHELQKHRSSSDILGGG